MRPRRYRRSARYGRGRQGPGLEAECRPLAPIRPGQVVATGGHGLPNRHVIHCLGPVYGREEPARVLLADCYRNALQVAEKLQLRSIAFPSISTGAYRFPIELAARIAVDTVRECLEEPASVKVVRFVCFSESDRTVYERLLAPP